jgi:rubrerythrin
MQIKKTWACPECGFEMERPLTADVPDQCPKCGWPGRKPQSEAEPFRPEEWPDR